MESSVMSELVLYFVQNKCFRNLFFELLHATKTEPFCAVIFLSPVLHCKWSVILQHFLDWRAIVPDKTELKGGHAVLFCGKLLACFYNSVICNIALHCWFMQSCNQPNLSK